MAEDVFTRRVEGSSTSGNNVCREFNMKVASLKKVVPKK